MRQFSRTLLGANPAEVREFLLAAAASLERVNGELAGVILERTTLQAAVKQANAEVEVLRAQLAEARNRLAVYRGQEAVLARAVLNAQQVTEELTRSSKEQAERTIAQANAAAKETIDTARQSAADLLRATRAHAQQAVEAADRTAAARIAEVEIEAERITAAVRSAAAEIQQAAQQEIEKFITRLEAFLANREELAGSLDALAKHHTDSLDVIAQIHAEVERVILPALRELTQTATEKELGARSQPVSGAQGAPASAAAAAAPAGARNVSPPEGGQRPVQPMARDGEGRHRSYLRRESRDDEGRGRKDRDRNGGHTPAPQPAAEIVVSPVHSYLQATKLVTAVSRMKGVQTARLRSYSKGTITIHVVTEAGTVAALDPRLISGGPLDVVEATDSLMVLRLGEVESGRPAGSGSPV